MDKLKIILFLERKWKIKRVVIETRIWTFIKNQFFFTLIPVIHYSYKSDSNYRHCIGIMIFNFEISISW